LINAEIIAVGRTAEILSHGNQQVLKLFRSGIPEHFIESEYKISKDVFDLGISCPQPIELIDYSERKGIIYNRILGITMLKSISKKLWTINKEAKRMARIHCSIHNKPVLNFPKQKDILIERIQHAPLLSGEEIEQIIIGLKNLNEETKLCHGDYHPDNIVLGEKEWIIDWMTGMGGNPAGDVARTILLLKLGSMPEGTPKIVKGLVSLIRNQILRTYIKEYTSISEITIEEINQWIIPIAAARLSEWIPEREKKELVELIRRS